MNNNVRMSQLTRGLLAVAIVGTGIANYGVAVAAVSAGRHNLSSAATQNNRTNATNEVCVFCHTPHGADVSTAGAPLWNKKFTTGTFTPYVATSTLEGAFATDGGGTGGFLSGASLACLSCHDGTQAIDNLLNAPGTGGLDTTGGGASGRAYAWSAGSSGNLNTSTGHLTGAPALAQDLSNDHPIGIRYCGGGPTVAAPGTACVDADFVAPSTGVSGSQTVFWVDTGTAGRQKTDMQLYVRGFAAGGTGPAVECASCHDVHSSNALFLRVSNANSAVCLACHTK